MIDKRVKERLTGALILVAAVVILVPEMFAGRARHAPPADDAPAAKPAGEGPPLRSYTIEVEPRARAGESPVVEPTPAPAPAPVAADTPAPRAAIAPPPRTPAAAPRVQPALPPAKAPDVAPRVKSAAAGGWFVQLGSFAQRANAERYAQEIARKGYDARVDSTGASGHELFRVRVGPSADRDAAARLQARLNSDGFKGTLAGPT